MSVIRNVEGSDLPMSRTGDRDTSHEAGAAFTEKRLSELQEKVLKFFIARGEASDEDLEDSLKRECPGFSTLRKRRTDLVKLGKIRDSGKRVRNRNNRNMIIWELTPNREIDGV